MKNLNLVVSFGALVALLSACSTIPTAAHFNHGAPESLLDVSSEVVSVDMVSEQSLDEVVNWIETDQPSRAELNCFEGDPLCDKAEQTLQLYGLEYQINPSEKTEVLLMYERVVTRDCEPRYIDNSVNPYNLYSPTLGCSVASNIVQMVTDKRQFVSPTLLDYSDAASTIRAYNQYINPPVEESADSDFTARDLEAN
ncbi:MAG: hypothetical protein K2Q12_09200 [Rickettsiales bacterium]|nr:hypothetical protein [Rickettsiales bacterium]